MAGTRDYYFKPDMVLRLLTHYTNGEVPMGAETLDFLISPLLGRMIGLKVASDEWTSGEPLHIRYDGKRIATWEGNKGVDKLQWEERAETPNRQEAPHKVLID